MIHVPLSQRDSLVTGHAMLSFHSVMVLGLVWVEGDDPISLQCMYHLTCRRFFETEGIAILTTLISRYKIEIKEEPEFAAETFQQRKERILQVKRGVTLT